MKPSNRSLAYIVFSAALTLTSCAGVKTVTVPEKQTVLRRDSVIVKQRDSVIIHKLRDTVFIEKYLTVDKFKLVKDTVDKEVPVTVEIEKPVTPRWAWYSVAANCLGVLALAGFAAFKIAKIVYLRKA